MANSGIQHVVTTVPIARTTFEDEEFHSLVHGTSFPASPVEKQLFYRSDLHALYIYNGTSWVSLQAAAPDELNDIGDVYVPSPTDEYLLYWDAPNSRWACRALVDADIPAAIARDTEVTSAISTHAGVAAAHHTKTVDASELTAGELLTARLSTNIKTLTITFIIDGGGSAITTGQKGHLRIPFACTIQRVTMLADVSGSIVVDIWKDTYANFPPDNADSITSAAPPTISSAQKSEDSTLTGWTTSIAADDILAYNVDSCATITRLTISLKVVKT